MISKINKILNGFFCQTLRHEFQTNLDDTRREYTSFSKPMLFGVPIVFGINISLHEASLYDWILYTQLGYSLLLSIFIHFKADSLPIWVMILHLPLFILNLIFAETILYEQYLAYPSFMVPLFFIVSFYFHTLKFSISLMVLSFGLLALIFYIRDVENSLILWNLYFGSTVITGLAIREITSRILYASNTDSLTGLYSRRYAEQYLTKQVHLSNRHSLTLSLIYVDVDDFKTINDSKGHIQGDEVLRNVANSLRQASRDSDIISRWGGDEFVIVLPLTNKIEAQNYIQRLVNNLQSVEVSCGLVELRKNEGLDDFLARADQSMYEDKNSKKRTAKI